MRHLIQFLLPSLNFDKRTFFLNVYITAFGKLAVCYVHYKSLDRIFSVVIEGKDSEEIDFDRIDSITDAKDFQTAVEIVWKRVGHSISKDVVKINTLF